MKVKVCGITRLEDARLACELGAWAVGFIFYPPSPRYISPEHAAEITEELGDAVEKVGVFVNASFEDIVDAGKKVNLTIAQLHGSESRSCAEELKPCFSDVWKAVRIGDTLPVSLLEEYHGITLLLDTYVKDRPGGTGKTFSWELAREAKSYARIILAGGLNPGNVGEAIRSVEPYGIDVGSGVECCPGRKDPTLLRDLFAKVTLI